jgi:uncharacterized protein
MRRRNGRGGRLAGLGPLLVAIALSVAACSSYVATSNQIRTLLRDGKYDRALEKLQGLESGGSRLLYLYERGLILHQQNRFEDSNEAFAAAEELLEDLYTRSISREAGALLVSENVREYRGDRFEAALVHYYSIMNYLSLGDLEAAAVQCRRLDHRLDVMAQDPNSFFTDHPFLRYLAGMVYFDDGDGNDADVSMRRALDLYRSPAAAHGAELPGRLFCDLADNVARLGEASEASSYREEGDCTPSPAGSGPPGTLRLFLECGEVAFKNEVDVVIPIFKNEIHDDLDQGAFAVTLAHRYGQPTPHDVEVEYLLRISMPTLEETPSGIQSARVSVRAPGDTTRARTHAVLGMDVTGLARRSFEEKQPALLLRAVARGLAKYLAKKKAEKEGGEAAGFALNIFGLATETADTRSWSTLPEKILLAQLDLAEGTYTIHVELLDPTGRRDDSFDIPDVRVSGGRSTFLDYRVY